MSLRILLTNDDGIHSTGFGVLERIAAALSDDVWVCAPEQEQSATSHSLTIHRPLRLRQVSERRFAADGTPTDCVLLAVNHVLKDHRPDLVLSGVNHGRNIAEDVTYSGTIAAAMEATLLGIRAVALSQEFSEDGPPYWSTAEKWGPDAVRRATSVDWPPGVLVNVNFPAREADDIKGFSVVPHGFRKIGDDLSERVDPRGRTYFWIGTTRADEQASGETDTHALRKGLIPVTPLFMNLSHDPTIAALKKTFQ
ncbi:MAG: 5'/3'-nucleotidase SurE [Inquilinus sp.]|nr:5'/3'-nucleotidase SurE [Inquilinus sp.]